MNKAEKRNTDIGRRSSGFTFIEILVVLGAMGMIMYAVSAIVLSSFRARTKSEAVDVVETSGTYVLDEMKKNLMNALPSSVSCPNNRRIVYRDSRDGDLTTLVCGESPYTNRIASVSASRGEIYLTNLDVLALDCTQFVTCNVSPASPTLVTSVDIRFGLDAAGASPEVSSTRFFNQSVVIRN